MALGSRTLAAGLKGPATFSAEACEGYDVVLLPVKWSRDGQGHGLGNGQPPLTPTWIHPDTKTLMRPAALALLDLALLLSGAGET